MTSPQLSECDIVMKGGVTSGVVYPAAIVEIAKRFRFRAIGGTSAGAIAAVVTAAAEYARAVESTSRGFDRIAIIPAELRTNGLLLRLFAPQLVMQPLFRFVVAAFSARPWWLKIPIVLATLFVYLVVPALAVLGVASIIPQQRALWSDPGAIAAEVAILAAVYVVAVFGWLLPRNAFGLTRAEKLSTWLTRVVDEAAFGANYQGPPLTFGMLWDPQNPGRKWPSAKAPAHEREEAVEQRVVDLQMMTTCISLGRPYRIPFEINILWFDPDVMRRYFPDRVVQHMIDHPRLSKNAEAFKPLIAFPRAQDLPVVVAARMSLSFPLLIAAVKLHAIDFSEAVRTAETDVAPGAAVEDDSAPAAGATAEQEPDDEEAPRLPKACWFSDGGLTSNFPVHFFDGPLPRRPTFGVNLGGFDAGHVYDPNDESNNVSMITSMRDDVRPEFGFVKGSITGFLSAIVGTMQNWGDSLQSRLPGYRDRIVHVRLRPNEGGLNLDMDASVLEALEKRGRAAGIRLVQRFDPADASGEHGWAMHRRVRYLSIMDMIQTLVRRFDRAWSSENPPQPTYRNIAGCTDPHQSYRRPRRFTDKAGRGTQWFASLDARWNCVELDFNEKAPRPATELRVRPPV
jgi:predicted acylesterase/phospholipase RssA